jgi:hypothetical protein
MTVFLGLSPNHAQNSLGFGGCCRANFETFVQVMHRSRTGNQHHQGLGDSAFF